MHPNIDVCVHTEKQADVGREIGKEMGPHMQSSDNAKSQR